MGSRHTFRETDVRIPTVVEDGEVNIKWFGEKDGVRQDGQFLFPLLTRSDDLRWEGDPEKFQVAFLGQVKSCSDPDKFLPGIARSWPDKEDSWVVLLYSDQLTTQWPGEPTGSLIETFVLLNDENVGIIYPEQYEKLSVLKKVSLIKQQ